MKLKLLLLLLGLLCLRYRPVADAEPSTGITHTNSASALEAGEIISPRPS